MLADADLDAAQLVAERIRSEIEVASFDVGARAALRATASLGVAASPQGGDRVLLTARADAALYESKHDGRNRVTAA